MTELAPGARYDRYHLEQRLGAGGLAEVWRAVDLSTGRIVALKRFTGALASADAERLRAEIELLATHALHGHPNVVDVYGSGTQPDPYIVMEYLDGGDLGREIARAGRLSIERTLDVGTAIANALSAAAEAGIVHGDVKPSNVLLGMDGAIKLADFNVARVTGYTGGSVPGSMLVSFAYAAPEVWEGHASSSSDLYALGCVLYECLTGHPPFTGSYAEVFRAHLERAPNLDALPNDTPDALRALIADLLAKHAPNRPRDAHSVALRLAGIARGITPMTTTELMPDFGLWAIESPHPDTPWAWRARNRQSGRSATVELFFGDQALGERITRAITENARLVPLGAETLIEANRLLLRPGESLGKPTPPGWTFWVARDERPGPHFAPRLDGPALATAAERVHRLVVAAHAGGLSLDLSPANLVVFADGSIYVRRPGVAPATVAEDANALATLRQLAIPGLVPFVARSVTLAALNDELARGDATADIWGTPQTAPAATVLGSDAPTVAFRAPIVASAMYPAAPPLAVQARALPAPPVAGTVARPVIRHRDDGSRRSAALAAALLFALGAIVLAMIAFVATGGLGNHGAAVLASTIAGVQRSPTAVPTHAPTPAPTPSLIPPVVVIIPSAAPITPAPVTPPPVTPPPVTPPPVTPPPTNTPPPVTPPPTNPPPPPTAWHVSLASSATQANNGDLVTFSATASQDVAGTGFVIQIFNPDTGFIHTSCSTGKTCSIGGRRANTTDRYQARVSAPDGSNVQAKSDPVSVTWSGPSASPTWTVSIASSQQTASNGQTVYITATASRDVSGTGFEIQIFNPDTGFVHRTCSTGTTCTVGGARQNTTAAYQARISAPDGSNVQAQSARITVTWR